MARVLPPEHRSGICFTQTNEITTFPTFRFQAHEKLSKFLITYQHFENLQLHQRPFLTVPYLGKGPGNVDVESTLKQGDSVRDRKTTIMDQEFMDYSKYPLNEDLKARFNDPSKSIEELAMEGWTRGGASTREVNVQRT